MIRRHRISTLFPYTTHFRSLRRVLRPGGRLAILEITTPRGPLRHFYGLWFDRVVPLLGKALPGGSAYTYLPASVRDRKSTRLNSSHSQISYAVLCLEKKKQ